MIPKILHFIWLSTNGTKMPEYGRFAISKFKEMNPDFEINVVQYTNLQQPSSWNDALKNELFKSAVIKTIDTNIHVYEHIRDEIKSNGYIDSSWETWKFPCNIGTKISDELRIKLLNKVGGIYLDLDCFPLKPFDDAILENDGFYMQNGYSNTPDIFFLGGNENTGIKWNNSKNICISNPLCHKMNTKPVNELKSKFINGTLSLDDVLDKKDIDSYIYHFYIGSKLQ